MDRRSYLLAGAGLLGALAGCPGRGDGTATTTSGTDRAAPATDSTPTTSGTPGRPRPYLPHLYGLSGSTVPQDVEGGLTRELTQRSGGVETSFEVSIPEALYGYYRRRLRPDRYGSLLSDTLDDDLLDSVAGNVARFADRRNLHLRGRLALVAAVVGGMDGAPAVGDQPDGRPSYPVETLVDRGGDPEDAAVLLAALLSRMGQDPALLAFPAEDHVAVGVDVDAVDGRAYDYRGRRYLHLEATSTELGPGESPFEDATPEVIVPADRPSVAFSWTTSGSREGGVDVNVALRNVGLAPAPTVRVRVAVEAEDGLLASAAADAGSIPPGETARGGVRLRPPPRRSRVRLEAFVAGRIHDRTASDWHSPGE